jgi:hypothetical protein
VVMDRRDQACRFLASLGFPFPLRGYSDEEHPALIPRAPPQLHVVGLLGARAWQGICSWGTLKWVWLSAHLIAYQTPQESGGAGCSQGKKHH